MRPINNESERMLRKMVIARHAKLGHGGMDMFGTLMTYI